jgi:NADH dehydrogenase [ubiquinone] 1 alpha subcomplex assembly factor 5
MDLGSGAGHIVKHLDPEITQKVVMVDSAGEARDSPLNFILSLLRSGNDETLTVENER